MCDAKKANVIKWIKEPNINLIMHAYVFNLITERGVWE